MGFAEVVYPGGNVTRIVFPASYVVDASKRNSYVEAFPTLLEERDDTDG